MITEKNEKVEAGVFVAAWEKFVADGKPQTELAEHLGMKLTSVQSRGSAYRASGIPLSHFTRGRTDQKRDIDALLKVIADARGITVEQLVAERDAAKADAIAKANDSGAG